MMRVVMGVAAMMVLAVVVGCAHSGLDRPVESVTAVSDTAGVQRVDVDMHSYYFSPNRIVVHKGHPVELTIRNRAVIAPHNFTIVDSLLTVDVDRWGLGASRVRFTPQVAGEYVFFCHVGSHSKKGMRGTLVVEP